MGVFCAYPDDCRPGDQERSRINRKRLRECQAAVFIKVILVKFRLDKFRLDKKQIRLHKQFMMKEFIGRKKELELLENAYSSNRSEFIPIYGRRRVGKSELILQFIKNKTGIYYLGKQAQEKLQISEFLRESSEVLQEPLLSKISPEGWKSALEAVDEKRSKDEKLIVVFDEFQWIVEESPSLPSILQEFWDRRWKKNGNMMFIICGSYIGFMESEILGKKKPLSGRRTYQIFLRPFGYREATKFHPGYSLTDQAETYFMCGGMPLYLEYFSSSQSVVQNIYLNFLNEFAPLYREVDFLLREEFREVETYYAILLVLSAGSATNKIIADKTGVDARKLHYYLKQLMELGYVARKYPLTSKNPSAREVKYILDDPLIRFWFHFIYPNMSYISRVSPARAFADRIRPGLSAYFGGCFERLCRESLSFLYRKEGVKAGFEAGEYWDRATQIDVIGLRDDNWTDIGECKWGVIRSKKNVIEELEKKIDHYPNYRNATIGPRIFSRQIINSTSTMREDIKWHSLEDLYSE